MRKKYKVDLYVFIYAINIMYCCNKYAILHITDNIFCSHSLVLPDPEVLFWFRNVTQILIVIKDT